MEKFASIPTAYNGVNFRSRLEARWAAFFDLCNWSWEYEPIDLNGWIPDFRLIGIDKTLVEVKPFEIDPYTILEGDDKGWLEVVTKIEKANPPSQCMLLGGSPFFHEDQC